MLNKALLSVLFIFANIYPLFAKTTETTLITGKNFADKTAFVNDALFYGIRVNQYLSSNLGVRIGIDGILNADFKNDKLFLGKNTNIYRFSMAWQYDFLFKKHNFIPYVYGGFGYEKVSKEIDDKFVSQPFCKLAGGIKFHIDKRYILFTEIEAIKKLYDYDFDYSCGIGVGYRFKSSFLEPSFKRKKVMSAKKISYLSGKFYKKKKTKAQKTEIKKDINTSIKQKIQKTKPTNIKAVTAKKENKPEIIKKREKPLNPSSKKRVYFIQMSAVFYSSIEKGEKRLIEKLKKRNLPFIIKKLKIKKRPVQRLLVGPYNDLKEAKSRLKNLKQINKNAFIRLIKQ